MNQTEGTEMIPRTSQPPFTAMPDPKRRPRTYLRGATPRKSRASRTCSSSTPRAPARRPRAEGRPGGRSEPWPADGRDEARTHREAGGGAPGQGGLEDEEMEEAKGCARARLVAVLDESTTTRTSFVAGGPSRRPQFLLRLQVPAALRHRRRRHRQGAGARDGRGGGRRAGHEHVPRRLRVLQGGLRRGVLGVLFPQV